MATAFSSRAATAIQTVPTGLAAEPPPGPVAWADQRFKLRRGKSLGWAQGFGILFDDVVAAVCTLVVIALWRFV